MRELYVIDTCALIAFFDDVFKHAVGYDGSPALSNQVTKIIAEAINSGGTHIRLSIPSVVFIEIYEKWLITEEFCRMFFFEVFNPLRQSPNVEIRSTDREVLERLLSIGSPLEGHDLHDRLILASAIALESPLITTDEDVTEYIIKSGVVPRALR